jgi:hypothetical protein
MIKITLETIRKQHPCKAGWKKVKAANNDQPFAVSSILDSNDLDDTLWVLRCLPEYDQLWRKFACWCALDNIELIEPYTDKYDQIVNYLIDPNGADVADAVDVARATYSAVDSAYGAAARSAYGAACAARSAYGAACAARSAYGAACAARSARSAYGAACAARPARDAYAAYKQKQVDKLRQILDAGEWVDD